MLVAHSGGGARRHTERPVPHTPRAAPHVAQPRALGITLRAPARPDAILIRLIDRFDSFSLTITDGLRYLWQGIHSY